MLFGIYGGPYSQVKVHNLRIVEQNYRFSVDKFSPFRYCWLCDWAFVETEVSTIEHNGTV